MSEDAATAMKIFESRQWAVTNDGICSIRPVGDPQAICEVDAAQLLDAVDHETAGRLYHWPLHIARQPDADIGDFLLVFALALWLHREKYEPEADFNRLEATVAAAREIAADR